MDFFMKLPRNNREFALFMAIVSFISVNIIAPCITFCEMGFHFYVWLNVLQVLPFIWLCVIALVLITYKPASLLTSKILSKGDSFNATIIVNTMCTVLMMSVVLTVVGTWIGNRQLTWEPIIYFFAKWPRNFAISLAVELLVAQPVARAVLLRLHKYSDSKNDIVN